MMCTPSAGNLLQDYWTSHSCQLGKVQGLTQCCPGGNSRGWISCFFWETCLNIRRKGCGKGFSFGIAGSACQVSSWICTCCLNGCIWTWACSLRGNMPDSQSNLAHCCGRGNGIFCFCGTGQCNDLAATVEALLAVSRALTRVVGVATFVTLEEDCESILMDGGCSRGGS